VAPKYPKVIFESYEGIKPAPNLRVYRLAQYEAYYLAGILAGKMVKNGHVGWVAGFAAPPYPSFANTFVMGGRSVNPAFKLNVVFMNKWSDPPGEKAAAESLAATGPGMVTNSMSSPTVLQTAESKGLFSLGRTEQCSYAPKGCLASFVVNWADIFEQQITTAMAGKLNTDQVFWANLKNNGVGLAEFNAAIPADVKALLEQTKADIASGKIQLYQGPMKDGSGAEKVPAGKTLQPNEVNVIDWFIDGVQVSK
jgi:basic membrane lipoprotein Med (substrate-binding protein (PBP1-ABC) superfamily)